MTLIGLIVVLPVSLFIIWMRIPILSLFGPEYVQASKVLILLMLSLPLVFITSILANYAIATNCVGFLVKLAAILAFTNILLNWLLISKYSILGAAISTFICEIMSLFILLGKFKYFYKHQPAAVGVSI